MVQRYLLFFFKCAKSTHPLYVDYVPSVFIFKKLKPETKKRTSSRIEWHDRQQKRKKLNGLVLKQSEPSVDAAEDEINLAVQEKTDKYKGWLFVPSNMDYFRFPVLLFLYSERAS